MKTLDRSTPRALAAGILAVLSLVTMTACGGSEARVGSSAGADAITTIRVGITGATAPPTFLPLIANKFGLDMISLRASISESVSLCCPGVLAESRLKFQSIWKGHAPLPSRYGATKSI